MTPTSSTYFPEIKTLSFNLETFLLALRMSTYFLFPITPHLLVVLDEIRVVVDVETKTVVEVVGVATARV